VQYIVVQKNNKLINVPDSQTLLFKRPNFTLNISISLEPLRDLNSSEAQPLTVDESSPLKITSKSAVTFGGHLIWIVGKSITQISNHIGFVFIIIGKLRNNNNYYYYCLYYYNGVCN